MKILREKIFTSAIINGKIDKGILAENIKKKFGKSPISKSYISHAKQADKIRENNPLGTFFHDIKRVSKQTMRQLEKQGITKKKLGIAAARDIAIAGTAIGGGIAAYKHYKNKKKDGDKEK